LRAMLTLALLRCVALPQSPSALRCRR
jgi:hypothetical protein